MTPYLELIDKGLIEPGRFSRRQVEDLLKVAQRDLNNLGVGSWVLKLLLRKKPRGHIQSSFFELPSSLSMLQCDKSTRQACLLVKLGSDVRL